MTKRKHDYQYYKDVERAAFAEELRGMGLITGELRGSAACFDDTTEMAWSVPIEGRDATLDLIRTFCDKCGKCKTP